jgi:D-tyrosyl-tRNA(Tyr) deacylase
MPSPRILVVASAVDPVAVPLLERWGALPATGASVDGAPIREFPSGALLLRRAGPHVVDERLDERLPPELRREGVTLVFPSIHRSEQNIECLAVHPLGNPGPTAEVGGRPRTLAPTDPRRMTAALRAIAEAAEPTGLRATYEATHHGPELGLPAFFVEIGYGAASGPPDAAVRILADVIPEIADSDGDRIAVGVGGGHYVPHFTDLALRRRWAFGHLLSRHALATLDAATARAAWDRTPGAEGLVYARAEDAKLAALAGLGARLREQDAPPRADGPTADASRSASGT